jgi:hypothetical protein
LGQEYLKFLLEKLLEIFSGWMRSGFLWDLFGKMNFPESKAPPDERKKERQKGPTATRHGNNPGDIRISVS